MSKLYDYLFKIIVIGDTNTGKTSLINTITTTNTNTETLPTIGIDFASANTVIDNNIHIKFHIWDTAGQEQFARVITHYYKNIAGGVIVFDLHKKNTFEKATTFWFQELKKNTNDISNSQIFLVGNKSDKERKISQDEIDQFISKHNITYIETSATEQINTQSFINTIASQLYDNIDHLQIGVRKGLLLKRPDLKKRSCHCCIC